MAEGWLRLLWCQASIILLRLRVKPDHEANNVWDPVSKSFELQVKRFESVEVTYDVGPGKISRRGFGRPQGPTDLCVEQPLNVLQERLLL